MIAFAISSLVLASTQESFKLSIDLDARFVNGYYRKVTIASDYRVQGVKGSVNSPAEDGEIHIGGFGDAAGRPIGFATVAEIWKAKDQPDLIARLRQAQTSGNRERITGVWRLWAEHANGTPTFAQGLMEDPASWTHASNPDHVFEIHPITAIGSGGDKVDLRSTLTFLTGFPDSTAESRAKNYFPRFESASCRITPRNGRVVFETNPIAINFIGFRAEPLAPPVSTGDGWRIHARIKSLDGQSTVAPDVKLVFPAGTPAASGLHSGATPAPMKLVGLARFALEKARQCVVNGGVFKGKLDYEMIVVSTQP